MRPFLRHRKSASDIPQININSQPIRLESCFTPSNFKVKDLAGHEIPSIRQLMTPQYRPSRQLSLPLAEQFSKTSLRRTFSQPQLPDGVPPSSCSKESFQEKLAKLKKLGIDSMFESAGVLNEFQLTDKPSHLSSISVAELWGEAKLNQFLVKNDLWDAYKFLKNAAHNRQLHANFHPSKPGKPYKMDENIKRRVSRTSLQVRPDISFTSIGTSSIKEKAPKTKHIRKKYRAFNSLLTSCDDLYNSNQPIQKACSSALSAVKNPLKPVKPKRRPLTKAEKRKIEEYMKIL